MKSSYSQNKYSNLFKAICFAINPKRIVEFGILEGYSLMSFVTACNRQTEIFAYDIFDEFPYNAANLLNIKNKFKNFNNVKIEKRNFYGSEHLFKSNSIDIIHIDIANNGKVFKYVFENYIDKLTNEGICILEGGSNQRDNVEWMKKYNKEKIVPVINSFKNKFDILVLEDYPSITIVKKRKKE